jgi:hypothetical protein
MKPPPRRLKGRGSRLAWIAALYLVLSCASAPPWLDGAGCPVVPVSSIDLPTSTRLRVRVRIGWGDRELGLQAIVRKRPEELVVVGLAPQGTRFFTIRQQGRAIEIDTTSSRKLEQLALWLLDALQRGLWIEPAAGPRRDDGASWSWQGEQVVEARRDGRWRREFRRAGDAGDVASVAIDYREPPHRGGQPGFEIRNTWCGYEAVLIPLDEVD